MNFRAGLDSDAARKIPVPARNQIPSMQFILNEIFDITL
jgi:hypothetical protein